jgi:hypothetical protein
VTSFFAAHCLKTIHKIIKNSAQQPLVYCRNFIPNSTLQFLYCARAIPVYACFQVSPQEEIRDREVRWPHRPWDTEHMKTLFVAQHATYSTDPLSLNWFANGMTSSVSMCWFRFLPSIVRKKRVLQCVKSPLRHPVRNLQCGCGQQLGDTCGRVILDKLTVPQIVKKYRIP